MLITVDPDAWYAASTKFGANVARTLSDAESALGATLADSGRIAGTDPSGAAWAQAYDQTAPAVAQAINDAVAEPDHGDAWREWLRLSNVLAFSTIPYTVATVNEWTPQRSSQRS